MFETMKMEVTRGFFIVVICMEGGEVCILKGKLGIVLMRMSYVW